MGENKRKRQGAVVEIEEADQPHLVNTLGGRMHVRWDEGASATPRGQLIFFAEFIATTGIFDHWGSACPLAYRSGNAPDKRDVLGTLMLGLYRVDAPGADALGARGAGQTLGARHRRHHQADVRPPRGR